MYKLLISLGIICVFNGMAIAQQNSETKGAQVNTSPKKNIITGDTYAIIFGISNYPGIKPLQFADKDAILFKNFLQTAAGGNVKTENIFFKINDSAKAATFNVKAYSWILKNHLKKGDRLFIYLSGHGDAMNPDNYFFLPFDCTPNKEDNNYLGTGNINMHTVKTLFIKPLASIGVDVILIIDACRTNELPNGSEGQNNFTSYITEQKAGEVIMLSTGAGHVSIESPTIGNGHGLFTYYLIDGLAGLADKEGDMADNNGIVSLGELTSYVKSRVIKDAKSKFGTIQEPFYCCTDRDYESMAIVDPDTYNSWVDSKKINTLTGNTNLFALVDKKLGKKGISGFTDNDTSLIKLYNDFTKALKEQKLVGAYNSAESIYTEMENKWPNNSLTEDAKFTLATEFINYSQEKINLFLSGKNSINITNMEIAEK